MMPPLSYDMLVTPAHYSITLLSWLQLCQTCANYSELCSPCASLVHLTQLSAKYRIRKRGYARLHGNGSYFLPFFWFLEFRKIYVSAIISSQAICFLASFTMVLQKKCKEPKNGIPKSWEDKLIDCPLSLKMSIFCKNGPEKWTLWPKIAVFVSSHNTSMLKEYKVYQNPFIL